MGFVGYDLCWKGIDFGKSGFPVGSFATTSATVTMLLQTVKNALSVNSRQKRQRIPNPNIQKNPN